MGIHLPSIYYSASMHVSFLYLCIVAFNGGGAWSVQHIYIFNECLSWVITRWSRVHHQYTFGSIITPTTRLFVVLSIFLVFSRTRTYIHRTEYLGAFSRCYSIVDRFMFLFISRAEALFIATRVYCRRRFENTPNAGLGFFSSVSRC